MSQQKIVSKQQKEELLKTLQTRFEKNLNRHKNLEWKKIQEKLEANPEKLWSLRRKPQRSQECLLRPGSISIEKTT